MPDPEKGSFHTPGPKGPPVRVGEEFKITLTPQAELEFRMQALERVILRMPVACGWYADELRRAGLQKLNLTREYFSGD
ncbi:hypothetical protein ES708_06779 [subsurface metagenome]